MMIGTSLAALSVAMAVCPSGPETRGGQKSSPNCQWPDSKIDLGPRPFTAGKLLQHWMPRPLCSERLLCLTVVSQGKSLIAHIWRTAFVTVAVLLTIEAGAIAADPADF